MWLETAPTGGESVYLFLAFTIEVTIVFGFLPVCIGGRDLEIPPTEELDALPICINKNVDFGKSTYNASNSLRKSPFKIAILLR